MIRGIIFDMDGTLIDTNDLVMDCIKKTVYKYMGYIPEKDSFNEIIGKPLDVQMSFFSEKYAVEMIDYYRKIYLERRDEDTKIFTGIIELLKALDESEIKMAIVSNKGSRGIEHGLEMFKMKNFFELILSVADVENKKPHPEAINKVLKIWNMKKEEVLFVGDSHNDILAANNAGVKSVLVGWSILPIEQFENLKIDYIIDEPMEIITII
ncbi:MAG: HAD-IIIA family hydrolase [Bacillota bacterium]|nr:HAD-IIIA family hydrolase [Bacillota bacterium]